MVGNFVARVSFRSCKDCFISVPQHFLPPNPTSHIVTFKVCVDDGLSSYFSWSGEVTSSSPLSSVHSAGSNESVIEINGLYALQLGLREGQEVLVTEVRNAVSLQSVTAEPVAVDDWEIMELNTDYIQNNLLHQVRVVWNGQILPVWVENSVCIFLKIANLAPEGSIGILEQSTEVHVSPKSRKLDPAASKTGHSMIDSRQTAREKPNVAGEDLRKYSLEDTSSATPPWKGWWTSSSDLLKDTVDRWILGKESARNVSSDHGDNLENLSDFHLTAMNNFEVRLRVHSSDAIQEMLSECMTGDLLDVRRLFVQPYTAFVLSSSLPVEVECPLTIAKVSRVQPPYEITEKITPSGKSDLKKQQEESPQSKSSKTSKPLSVIQPETKNTSNRIRRECFVRVVIVDVLMRQLDGHCISSRLSNSMVRGVVYLPDLLRQHLQCEITSSVVLQFGTRTLQRPDSIKLQPAKMMVSAGSTACRHLEVCHWLPSVCSARYPIVAANGSILHVVNENGFDQKFFVKDETQSDGDNGRVLLVSPSVKVYIDSDVAKNHQLPILLEVPVFGLKSAALGGMDDLIRRGLEFLTVRLGLGALSDHLTQRVMRDGGLLICGSRGSGKTTLAQTLSRELADTPHRVHCGYVACKALKGKRVESVYRVWLRTFQEAIYRAPSVVLLDDLDHLTGSSTDVEQERGGAAGYQLRMSSALLELLKAIRMSRNSSVVVVATSFTAASMHPSLSSSRGVHIFQDVLNIMSPTLEQRNAILQRLVLSKTIISPKSCDSVDWRLVSGRTEGFVSQDMDMLLDHAVHVASKKPIDDSEILLSDDDLKSALANFVPASLRGLQLQRTWTKGWNDVGGLRDVKRILVETLQWPAKFPEIFSRCPLQLRSGVLLYGPVGTGKTLLAGAVAKECDMNFISINGPELLSKYIGASEQSVRDLFQRASSAKPCIIFFDEFDSLASKRGHDSTGVTDRVVNQLLTEMDGVGGRQGVYVLAATSRPDLIDPALLRPGRFDRCLYCPMPSQEERVEILEALTRSVHLPSNIDLVEIAALCDHFSGADLQGLLCNAQLKAIHRLSASDVKVSLDEFCCVDDNNRDDSSELTATNSDDSDGAIFLPSLEEGISPLDDHVTREKVFEQLDTILSNSCGLERRHRKVEVNSNSTSSASTTATTVFTNEDLLNARGTMKPSVSAQERQRYDRIYGAFAKSRGGHFDSGSEASTGTKRATLA